MKIKNWEQKLKDNKELGVAVEIINIIENNGYEALVVGGFVRDLILDIESDDIDISSNINEDKLSELFDIVDIGASKSFGVFVIKYKGFVFEIAHYRSDLYDGITGKGADGVKLVQSFKDDAARRDLTINALGLTKDGDVVDYFNGLEDIQNKVINTVGNPYDRFEEDFIRMMRVVRFSVKLGFEINNTLISEIRCCAHNIVNVSAERILKEMNKMASLTGSHFANAIELLDASGLLKHILPEVAKMKGLTQNPKFHPEGPVFEHVMAALRSSDVQDVATNWAILLHDVGKIVTHTVDETGDHFYKHQLEAPDMIDVIADRLKFDSKTRETVKFVALNHMTMHDFLKVKKSVAMRLIDSDDWDVLLQTAYADSKSRGDLFDVEEWHMIESRVGGLREWFKGKQATDAIRKVVNGQMVTRVRPEVPPSPEMGRIIVATVEWVIDNDIHIEDVDKIEEFMKTV